MNRYIVFECCCFLCSDRGFKIKRSKEKLKELFSSGSDPFKMLIVEDRNSPMFNFFEYKRKEYRTKLKFWEYMWKLNYPFCPWLGSQDLVYSN